MENLEIKFTRLTEHVEDYFKTREELAKLTAAEKSSVILSELLTFTIILFAFSIVFLFLSFAAAYMIAEYSGKTYLGFIYVTGFYLLLGILLLVNRKKWLRNPVMNSIIKNFFKRDNDEPHQ